MLVACVYLLHLLDGMGGHSKQYIHVSSQTVADIVSFRCR